MPTEQHSIAHLIQQIAEGTSLGEQFYQDRCQKKQQIVGLRLDKLTQALEKEQGMFAGNAISSGARSGLIKRAYQRDMEISQRKKSLVQLKEDSRVFSRARKARLFTAMQALIDGAELLTDNLQHRGATLADIQALYDVTKQDLWSVGPFCRRFMRYICGHLGDIMPIKTVYNTLSDAPTSQYARLATELSRDPDFYLFFLRSGRLATIFSPEAPIGKLFKEQVRQMLSGQEVKRAFDRKHQMHIKELAFVKSRFVEAQVHMLQHPTASTVMVCESFYNRVSDLTRVIQAEERALASLVHTLPQMEQLAQDAELVDALYQLWYAMVCGFEKMALDCPQQHEELAQSLAVLCSENSQDFPSFFNKVLVLTEKFYAMQAEQSSTATGLLSPSVSDVEAPQAVETSWWQGLMRLQVFWQRPSVVQSSPIEVAPLPVPGVSDCIATIHARMQHHMDASLAVALAYGKSKILDENIDLTPFQPFFRDILLGSAAPGKLPDYALVRQMLDILARGDVLALSDHILAFTTRHNLLHVVHKHAELLARETCVLWGNYAGVTEHFGFGKQTVVAFEPVLKQVFSDIDEHSVLAFHEVGTCILRMVFQRLQASPSVMELLDKLFILLDASPKLRQNLVREGPERRGMLQFFRVLFKNKLLITDREAAATRIQTQFRTYLAKRERKMLGGNVEALNEIRLAKMKHVNLAHITQDKPDPVAFVSYDRGNDTRAEPVDLTWWQRFNVRILQFFLRRYKERPAGLLNYLAILAQDPSQDSFWDRWFTFAGFLRARVPIVDPGVRLLLTQLHDSLHVVSEVNPAFFRALLHNPANHFALYHLLKVLINPQMPNNCPQAIDAIEKLFETVMDEVVSRPETYPAVQGLLAIWLDPDRFGVRVEQARDFQVLVHEAAQNNTTVSASKALQQTPPAPIWHKRLSEMMSAKKSVRPAFVQERPHVPLVRH